tara:strand:- start:6059 stop:6661 length:603 start_codon:yes stop_codon:yes gene_type:complete
MGFINNHKDNFLPSANPWGDDNVTRYNFPTQSSIDVSSMDFNQLKETFDDMRANYESLPPCPAKQTLKQKMMSISKEIKKRNSIEEIARVDRDDNFEIPKRIIKEDVITPTPPLEEVLDNVVDFPTPAPPPSPVIQTLPVDSGIDAGNELLEELLEEVEEMDRYSSPSIPTQASLSGKNKEFDNFLIAALVIITIIAVTK